MEVRQPSSGRETIGLKVESKARIGVHEKKVEGT